MIGHKRFKILSRGKNVFSSFISTWLFRFLKPKAESGPDIIYVELDGAADRGDRSD